MAIVTTPRINGIRFVIIETILQFVLHAFMAFGFSNCASKQIRSNVNPRASNNTFLEDLLKQHAKHFSHILANPDSFRVQVIYTKIDRRKNNEPVFTDYFFNVDPERYFYPASSIKLPIALAALEKIGKLKKHGVDKNTSMITEGSYSGQTAVYNEPTSADGKPSVAHYIKKIFLVSDNDASNRLYEFLGQEDLNKLLHSKGYRETEIWHRLSINMTEPENRATNPIKFLNDTGLLIYDQPSNLSSFKFKNRSTYLGKGFMEEGKLIHQPFDFSKKNQVPLHELHSMLKTVLFPTSVSKKRRFNISGDDRNLVLKYMSQYPAESSYPHYDSTRFWDGYGKFLLWGSEKQQLPKHIRIFNKIGSAYGFITDVAYLVDFEKNIEFQVSATIYCNSDGIFNDDKYEYSTVGLPFMKWLGSVLYSYETTRKRIYRPDLKEFKMDYEK